MRLKDILLEFGMAGVAATSAEQSMSDRSRVTLKKVENVSNTPPPKTTDEGDEDKDTVTKRRHRHNQIT